MHRDELGKAGRGGMGGMRLDGRNEVVLSGSCLWRSVVTGGHSTPLQRPLRSSCRRPARLTWPTCHKGRRGTGSRGRVECSCRVHSLPKRSCRETHTRCLAHAGKVCGKNNHLTVLMISAGAPSVSFVFVSSGPNPPTGHSSGERHTPVS
ncbi:hypothetical protein E2C01_074012 [Portunus trituberculatus]|uniref:Uncharacterized protein n=1 Tax=Portunus trituberculatus TaxID=210409 RepID=A0A5B7IB16_PORTR|nr:hypothetical protein [Portunus trituberculatus]